MISSSIGPCDQLLDPLSYQSFDLSMGYHQIKSEPTMFVMLSYSWLFPRAYTILSFGSDQCYHLVHIIVEFHLYGNLDELLLSPSTTSLSSPCFVLNIQLVLETYISIIFVFRSWRICLDERSDFLWFTCIWCKLSPWVRERLFLFSLESSQVSHACAKYSMVW